MLIVQSKVQHQCGTKSIREEKDPAQTPPPPHRSTGRGRLLHRSITLGILGLENSEGPSSRALTVAFPLTFPSAALAVPGHLDGVVRWEDAVSAGPHVVALVPVVLRLDLHQEGVVHLQLQLVVVPRDEPAEPQ